MTRMCTSPLTNDPHMSAPPMMTRTVGLVWLACACALQFVAPAPACAQVTVSRVIDGDTFVLSDDRRVRLIGIDAPEKRLPRDSTRTEHDRALLRALADLSTRHLESLVEGRVVELEFDDVGIATNHVDFYGRTLAYVWIRDGEGPDYMVNRRMVSDGFANAYVKYPFAFAEEFLELQRRARDGERGLWSPATVPGASPVER